MAKLVWDAVGKRLYETGVERAVLYVQSTTGNYENGVAWNGFSKFNKKATGAEITKKYANNRIYANLVSEEELEGSIEAFTYPDEFEECDGSKELLNGVLVGQQTRKSFGLTYRTKIGSDIDADLGYKIHIIYGCRAGVSERSYETINESPEIVTLSWEVKTTPVFFSDDFKPTASLEINSTKFTKEKIKKLEDVLYGTEENEPRIPLPAEVKTLLGD